MTTISDTGHCAILTRFLSPTNHRGARIKAVAKSGKALSVTISYPHELNQCEAHGKAALALCEKMGWTPDVLHAGGTPDGYVFVMGRG